MVQEHKAKDRKSDYCSKFTYGLALSTEVSLANDERDRAVLRGHSTPTFYHHEN